MEYYTNEEGQRVKKIIQKQRKVVTTIRKESVERFETTVNPAPLPLIRWIIVAN